MALTRYKPGTDYAVGHAKAFGDNTGYVPGVTLVGSDGTSISAAAGFTGTASFTPTAVAYGAGDIFDVSKEFALTLADGTAVPAGSHVLVRSAILKIDVAALQASEAQYTLQCYTATQPSAQADNAAWSLASADLATYLGAAVVGTPVDLGAAIYVRTLGLNLDFKLTTSSIWGRLTTSAAFTPTAVARQITLQGIVL